MEPTIVRDGQFSLDKNVGLSSIHLRQAQAVVEAHIQEIQHAWNQHFGG